MDGKTETFDVIVQADVEFLRIQLKRLVPTANIDPIPISNTVVILRGTVDHIEDVARATGTAATAMPGVQILNDLRVVGVPAGAAVRDGRPGVCATSSAAWPSTS